MASPFGGAQALVARPSGRQRRLRPRGCAIQRIRPPRREGGGRTRPPASPECQTRRSVYPRSCRAGPHARSSRPAPAAGLPARSNLRKSRWRGERRRDPPVSWRPTPRNPRAPASPRHPARVPADRHLPEVDGWARRILTRTRMSSPRGGPVLETVIHLDVSQAPRPTIEMPPVKLSSVRNRRVYPTSRLGRVDLEDLRQRAIRQQKPPGALGEAKIAQLRAIAASVSVSSSGIADPPARGRIKPTVHDRPGRDDPRSKPVAGPGDAADRKLQVTALRDRCRGIAARD